MTSLALGLAGGLGRVAAAAADRGIVHEHAAGAAGVDHAAEAVAAGLDHLAALGVAAGARDADAVRRHLAVAHAHGQVAAIDHHAVHHAAATAHAAGQHRAQVLHHAAGHLVVTTARDLHAARTFLELVRAARHHPPVYADRLARRGGRRGSAHARDPHARHAHAGPLHHHCARHEPNSFPGPALPPVWHEMNPHSPS